MMTKEQDHNIVLTGFMGTGKSVVGQRVAARLGYPFVDMDIEVERRAGRSKFNRRILLEGAWCPARLLGRRMTGDGSSPGR